MDIYLVGGAVRDELLNRPVHERDWLVVGASPEEMLKLGYIPVGKEFPVFLHPETKEEYALARTERKVSKGYKGFVFHADPQVTLEEDLKRRDLTINAIARSSSGEIIDPFHGRDDLTQKILRHVSPAFVEDPVRILRVARFAATLEDFKIHPDTNKFMNDMVKNGEVDALIPERVWKELSRALDTAKPNRFFSVLNDCDALEKLFPEIKMDGVGLKMLQISGHYQSSGPERFAALCYDMNTDEIHSLCTRLHVPKEYSDLALLCTRYYPDFHAISSKYPENILSLLKKTDAFRREGRFHYFCNVCELYYQVQHDINETERHKLLLNALRAAKEINTDILVKKGLKGEDFAFELETLRLLAIKQICHH